MKDKGTNRRRKAVLTVKTTTEENAERTPQPHGHRHMGSENRKFYETLSATACGERRRTMKKARFCMHLVTVLSIIVSLFLSGCATTKGDWEKTSQINTVEAYREFLHKHPQSEFSLQGETRIEQIEWEKTKLQDTVQAYKEFGIKYPKCQFMRQAKERIIELEWDRAKKARTVEGYKKFLNNYPTSKFSLQAKETLEKIEWLEAKKLGTVESYHRFLHNYPSSEFSPQAKETLERLEWNKIKKRGDIEEYQRFLNRYPDSKFASEAKKEVKKITEVNKIEQMVSQIAANGPGTRFLIRGIQPIGDMKGPVKIDGSDPSTYWVSGVDIILIANPFDEYGRSNINFQSTTVRLCPFGDGAVYQFIGEVNLSEFLQPDDVCLGRIGGKPKLEVINKLKRYTFLGEGTAIANRLTFAVVKNLGFVYVSGKGKVIAPGGKLIKLGY